jgi:cysteine desulfurase
MRIYLDHNATTPVREEVAAAMAETLAGRFGNPSSVHAEGAAARAAVERARERVAALLGCAPRELLFTSGATEANNTVLGPVLRAWASGRRHLISSNVEHPSVEEPLAALEREGWRVTRLPVAPDGLLSPEQLAEAIGPDTALVTLLWANNETGVVQPMERLVALARERGVRIHADATQCPGKLPLDLERLPLDALSLSAHKFGGPKGVGALALRGDPATPPLLRGGPQERRRRGGTENVPGIVGMGAAAALAARELTQRQAACARLRDRLWEGIAAKIPRVRRNGAAHACLCNTLNVEFEGAAGELLLQALDLEGIAVSAGAACASGRVEASHVLQAMGRSLPQARASLRMSLGHGVDDAQIEQVLARLPDLVARAREAGEA